jgi:hypothetical protein
VASSGIARQIRERVVLDALVFEEFYHRVAVGDSQEGHADLAERQPMDVTEVLISGIAPDRNFQA